MKKKTIYVKLHDINKRKDRKIKQAREKEKSDTVKSKSKK